jgi:hypothetical protein
MSTNFHFKSKVGFQVKQLSQILCLILETLNIHLFSISLQISIFMEILSTKTKVAQIILREMSYIGMDMVFLKSLFQVN